MLSPQVKRSPINPRTTYSAKLFVGAVPPGTSEFVLRRAMCMYGEADITWPNKNATLSPMQGYVFVIFKDARSVNNLLTQCVLDAEGKFMFYVPELAGLIIPFALNLATYVIDPLWFRFVRLSVFIGGLPRSCTARDLATSITANFGPLLHASIELDVHHNYPKGAARVVFRRVKDYVQAAQKGHVSLEIAGNIHWVEMKPFFYHGISCEVCSAPAIVTDFFCTMCLKYLCKVCWSFVHKGKVMASHCPIKDTKRELPASCRNAIICHSAAV